MKWILNYNIRQLCFLWPVSTTYMFNIKFLKQIYDKIITDFFGRFMKNLLLLSLIITSTNAYSAWFGKGEDKSVTKVVKVKLNDVYPQCSDGKLLIIDASTGTTLGTKEVTDPLLRKSQPLRMKACSDDMQILSGSLHNTDEIHMTFTAKSENGDYTMSKFEKIDPKALPNMNDCTRDLGVSVTCAEGYYKYVGQNGANINDSAIVKEKDTSTGGYGSPATKATSGK